MVTYPGLCCQASRHPPVVASLWSVICTRRARRRTMKLSGGATLGSMQLDAAQVAPSAAAPGSAWSLFKTTPDPFSFPLGLTLDERDRLVERRPARTDVRHREVLVPDRHAAEEDELRRG